MKITMKANSVCKISRAELCADDQPWDFALANAAAIDQSWQLTTAQNPKFFNGPIFVMSAFDVSGGVARGQFVRTDFKSYLFWRNSGWPEAGVLDGFGSALIRARDGGILLARQNAGHVNAGLVYLPGGFIDARDCNAAGVINIAQSVAREVLEETGLGPDILQKGPGYYLTDSRPQVSFAVPYLTHLTSADLKRRVEDFIAAGHDDELGEIMIAHRTADIEGLNLAPYARLLLGAIFDGL